MDPLADLEVIKLVSNSTSHKGDIITWTIIVTNKGPDVAVDVKVSDKLPNGLIYKSHAVDTGLYDSSIGVWSIGDMKLGDSYKLIITSIVDADQGNITNIAIGNSSTPDNNTDNNKGNNTTHVNGTVDLEIVKLVSNKNTHKGEIINWTIIVTNKGNSDAKNVRVTDKLPAGLVFKGSDGNYDPQSGLWIVGDLASGQSASLVITTLVNITNTTIRNVANVTSDTPDSNDTNNEANNTTDVSPDADLGIVKLVSNSTVHKGDIVKWTIIVTNNGPDVAENVYVNDILPNVLVYKAHTTTKGIFDSNQMLWFITRLASGESQILTIDTLVNTTNTKITNIVNVTSDTPDSNQTNNVANNTTDVPPEADIGVVKQVNATQCVKDQIVEWKIIMTNHGPDDATDVVVKDNLPNTLIFISSDGNYNPQTGIWTIDHLASGETRVLTIITKINTTGMVIVNNVTATSGVYDPDMSNNKASNNTTVVDNSLADLGVVKVVSNSNPRKGDIIKWTITVTNYGPDTAKNVKVTDKLPKGLVFISSDGNYNKNTGVWTIGDLANGKSVKLVITTRVDITNTKITNVAVVSSTTPDNNTDNNKDNDTIKIDPEADIGVVKTVSNPKPYKGDVITWTVIVTNFGPDAAENVYVEELLPEGLTLLSAKGSKGSYDNGIWKIGTLKNAQTATLILTTKVTVSSGTIENIVVASSSTYDPNKSNNKDKEVTKPKARVNTADLEIIKTSNVKVVKKGEKIIWTIKVINHGPNKALNVVVEDIVEKGKVKFVNAKFSKGEFDSKTRVWTIGDMEAGETATLIITDIALSTGEIINCAYVTTDTKDPNPDNDESHSRVKVVDKEKHKHPNKKVGHKTPTTMHATGNPIVMAILALLAIVGVSLKRRY